MVTVKCNLSGMYVLSVFLFAPYITCNLCFYTNVYYIVKFLSITITATHDGRSILDIGGIDQDLNHVSESTLMQHKHVCICTD